MKFENVWKLVVFVGSIWLLGIGFSRAESSSLRVVTTTGMLGNMVREIGGDHVEVEWLMGSGVDPHVYKHTRGDMLKLRRADVVFYNGLFLEAKLESVLEQLKNRGRPVYAAAEAIELSESELLDSEDYENKYDPHLWMDVAKWSRVAKYMTRKLKEHAPEHADVYQQRSCDYLENLEELDAYAHKVLSSIPESQRALVTAHDAFGYFGEAYDIEVRGIQGVSTASEAGLHDIESLLNFIVERDIHAIFIETSVSDKNVRALVEGARSREHELRIGGELFSDAMGKKGTYRGTYLGMIDHNVTTIARALDGKAPKKGLNGKL